MADRAGFQALDKTIVDGIVGGPYSDSVVYVFPDGSRKGIGAIVSEPEEDLTGERPKNVIEVTVSRTDVPVVELRKDCIEVPNLADPTGPWISYRVMEVLEGRHDPNSYTVRCEQ